MHPQVRFTCNTWHKLTSRLKYQCCVVQGNFVLQKLVAAGGPQEVIGLAEQLFPISGQLANEKHKAFYLLGRLVDSLVRITSLIYIHFEFVNTSVSINFTDPHKSFPLATGPQCLEVPGLFSAGSDLLLADF